MATAKTYQHPPLSKVQLTDVLQALSDPYRMGIVLQIAKGPAEGISCSAIPMTVAKATRSHHFSVLRSAGVIETHVEGKESINVLRTDELERRFPGLLPLVLSEGRKSARG